MDLLSKINIYLDYNNHFTINKAMRTLKREFELAKKFSNRPYAQEVVRVTKHIYDVLTSTYVETAGYQETMSWPQKVQARNLRKLILWMERKMGSVKDLTSGVIYETE